MTREEYLKSMKMVQKMDFKDRVNDLNALKQAFGEQVVEIVLTERGKKVEQQWQQIASQRGKNDIEDLKETLWAWVQQAGFEFTSTETGEGTQFHVTRCPLAEIARELQAADWGYTCFCADDPHIVAGFNPAMGFRRTKTLMEGHDCSDHFYYMKSNLPE